MTGCDLVKVKPKENNPERNCKNELSIQLQNEGVDESKTMDKDGGYGWIIVAASFSVHMIGQFCVIELYLVAYTWKEIQTTCSFGSSNHFNMLSQ